MVLVFLLRENAITDVSVSKKIIGAETPNTYTVGYDPLSDPSPVSLPVCGRAPGIPGMLASPSIRTPMRTYSSAELDPHGAPMAPKN